MHQSMRIDGQASDMNPEESSWARGLIVWHFGADSAQQGPAGHDHVILGSFAFHGVLLEVHMQCCRIL